MRNIAICIPTYKRLDTLEILLESIDKQVELDEDIYLNIIIVDNDIDESARIFVEKFTFNLSNVISKQYFSCPEKGLCRVRNFLIEKSLELGADGILFIDDDEYVVTDWLINLLYAFDTKNADVVRGPVFAKLPLKGVDNALVDYFDRPNRPNLMCINDLATGNTLIDAKIFRDWKLRFDMRFNEIGSEDSYLGKMIIARGGMIVWASKAVAYEIIPMSRCTLNWQLKRKMRCGGTLVYVNKILKAPMKNLLIFVFIALLRIFIGIICLPIIIMPTKKRYFPLYSIYDGVGKLLGFFNLLYKEYK